jgi:hypothetical protein
MNTITSTIEEGTDHKATMKRSNAGSPGLGGASPTPELRPACQDELLELDSLSSSCHVLNFDQIL